MLVAGQLPDLPTGEDAIQFGHSDIEDDQRDLHLRSERHSFQPIIRHEHVLVDGFQLRLQDAANQVVVVCDNDTGGFGQRLHEIPFAMGRAAMIGMAAGID